MNVKPKLYDDMLYISPENMRILSNGELESYGLVLKDLFQEEADAVRIVKSYGISHQEYANRLIRAKAECGYAETLKVKKKAKFRKKLV